MRRMEDGSPGYWMGMRGAGGGLRAAWGWRTELGAGTSWSRCRCRPPIAHELGHNLSLWHAACGNAGRPDRCVVSATRRGVTIGSWGYNRDARRGWSSPYSPDIHVVLWQPVDWRVPPRQGNAVRHRDERAEAAAARFGSDDPVASWCGGDWTLTGNPFLELRPSSRTSLPSPSALRQRLHRCHRLDRRTARRRSRWSFGMPMMARRARG